MTTPKLDDTLKTYDTDLELVSSRLIFSAFSSRLIFSSSVTLSSSESGMYLSGISTLLGTYSYTQKQAVSTNSFITCRTVSITLCDSVLISKTCNYFSGRQLNPITSNFLKTKIIRKIEVREGCYFLASLPIIKCFNCIRTFHRHAEL